MKIILGSLCCLTLGLGFFAHAGEHGGKGVEHGGHEVEHGGKKVDHDDDKKLEKSKCKKGEEAVKDKESGESKCRPKIKKSSAADIKKALKEYIAIHSDKGQVFRYVDRDRKNIKMDLKFVKIHDPVRYMEKKGQYFACTDFAVLGKEGQLHDLDFWLEPTSDGLKVVRTKVHKDPKKISSKWEKVPRYTFSGEEIVSVKR